MVKTHSLTLFTVIALTVIAAQAAAEEKHETRDKQARKLCQQFWDNVKNKDVDALMKIVAVPFYEHGGKTNKIIRDRDELKKELQKLFPGADVPKDLTIEIRESLSYEKVIEKYGEQLKKRENGQIVETLDRILKKDDRVLNVQFKTSDGKKLADALLTTVAWRNGKAKVVGVVD